MAPDLPSTWVPRPGEFDQVLTHLLHPIGAQPVAITTAVHGAAGYGKTTLATALCHDDRVLEAFDDGVLWTSLGQTPAVLQELTKLYAAQTGQHPAFVDAGEAAAAVAQRLEHRQCLFVDQQVNR